MSLVSEIYEFFNEGRPRTVNVGVDDIPRPGSGRPQRDPDIEDVGKKVVSRVNVNPKGERSEYKPGSVHEIRFNNVTKGVTQKVYTIYRTLSEDDYKTLKTKASPKVVTLVTPTSEPAHDFDVYYITIPKMLYGARKGAGLRHIVYLGKDRFESLTAEQKQKIKLERVPIKDIADGLSERPFSREDLKLFLSGKQKEKVKKEKSMVKSKEAPKQSSDDADVFDMDLNLLLMGDEDGEEPEAEPEAEPEKPSGDSPKEKAAKQKAAEFMLDDKIDRVFSQIIREYNVYTAPGSQKEKMDAKGKMSDYIKKFIDNLFTMTDTELERKAVIEYNVASKLEKKQELYRIIKLAYDNMESIKETTLNEAAEIKDDQIYDASVKYDGGKSREVKLKGKALKKLIDKQEFVYNKEIPFETVVDDPKRGMVPLKGTVKVPAPAGRSLKLIGRRTPDGTPIAYDPAVKEPEEKEKVPTKTLRTTISGQGSRSVKVPDNRGVKRADITPPKGSQLAYKFYVIDNKNKEIIYGTNDWKEAKDKAAEMGSDFEAVQKIALTAKGIEIKEAMSQEDKDKLMGMRVSFTIQSDLDPDKQFNISDNVKSIKDEKDKFIIVLTQAGTITFDKMGTGIFKYSKDNKEYQALNVPADLMSIVKKSFEPAKKEKEPESTLEAYIRKRIQEALKETEISQYWGYQGDDVKKKRLEEYMKKYHWGFQTSENPYEHSIGSEIHGVVTKLVHELGDEGLAIFNSYAPKGFEAADMSELDQMSDTPLGSQLTQPYNPDSLTARGGRVAEEDDKVTTGASRAIEKISAKYKDVEALAKGYNAKDSDIMASPSAKNVVKKAIAKAYGDNPAKAGPELKKAFMSMSDEDLKKSK